MGIGTVGGTRDAAARHVTAGAGQPSRAALARKHAEAPWPSQASRIARAAVITLTGGLAGMAACSLAPVLAEVALSAFAAPPWNETPAHACQLVSRMLADAQQPGFTLALAFTSGGARLAGFGYGLPRCPATGSAADSLLFADTEPFELCQLAVRPAARRIGAGRALHDAVLATSGPQPRWLVTHPAARPAVRLYQTSGWRISRTFPSATNGSGRLLMTRRR